MIEEKLLDADKIDRADPLGFVLADGGAQSLVDAAYRFCRHAPGVHVTLTGTGSLDHLKENIASLERGPLSDESLARLEDLFGHIHTISGN
jgi:aryl-alcohol dehydrogenase-like predicted oxidoreductase